MEWPRNFNNSLSYFAKGAGRSQYGNAEREWWLVAQWWLLVMVAFGHGVHRSYGGIWLFLETFKLEVKWRMLQLWNYTGRGSTTTTS